MKREKLIKSLKVAINALKNDTVNYDWHKQSSCNCGVVAQAILGRTEKEVSLSFHKEVNKITLLSLDATWKNLVKNTCSITGKTNVQILNDLSESGMSIEDICHLEFLEDNAILDRSGIRYTGGISKKVKTGTKKVLVKKRFLLKDLYKLEDVFETKKEQVKDYLFPDYFKEKQNLIKYLVAWVLILEEENKSVTKDSTKEELCAELLKAVSNEDYERATELRDLISVK